MINYKKIWKNLKLQNKLKRLTKHKDFVILWECTNNFVKLLVLNQIGKNKIIIMNIIIIVLLIHSMHLKTSPAFLDLIKLLIFKNRKLGNQLLKDSIMQMKIDLIWNQKLNVSNWSITELILKEKHQEVQLALLENHLKLI